MQQQQAQGLAAISEDFWLSLQLRWDLYKARKTEAKEIKTIRPIENAEKIA
jgi:antitoxin HigA-1